MLTGLERRVFDILLLLSFLIIPPKSGSCGNSPLGQLGAVDQITDSCARDRVGKTSIPEEECISKEIGMPLTDE